jgi:hypothetical protein
LFSYFPPSYSYSIKAIIKEIFGLVYTARILIITLGGRNVPEICREIGVTVNTYYRWRKEYGGMQVNQAKRLKELEKENSRLKRAVADLTLDNLILKESSEGNF